MVNIGIIGLGLMGMTHFAAYKRHGRGRVVAVADQKFASGEAIGGVGNIVGQSSGADLGDCAKYAEAADLLADPNVAAVDICAPTPAHVPLALAAIRAGKHVLLEKPAAPTAAEARTLTDAAKAAGVVLMPAHCMRFWPGWDWLKNAVASGEYGAVLSATFTRIGAQPPSPFYHDGAASGGAHLDLHIHDTDFVAWVFGRPLAVTSFGRRDAGGAIFHTLTRYHYGADAAAAPLVTAEGAWTREPEKRPFVMRYAVEFERASAGYEFGEPPVLTLYEKDAPPRQLPLASELGYDIETARFAECAAAGRECETSPAAAAVTALEIIGAEQRSLESGQTVRL
ncbi:MAG: Gfo/Idh/MocA family oxidoreductase [Puniceicoccales bacterium]|jgi:predicted dehydrogenase|nr:Gfo/Idh/MocA family oxidoreductase [Puniceicoccales bacterium]